MAANGAPTVDRRDTFLLQMYREVWNNINRHLTVVWQSAGVLAGSFAIMALVERLVISIDLASALLVLIAAWLVAHTYDANAWFNRNLVIAANIERQFLRPSDAHDIHYFFTRHRTATNVVGHLQIHRTLGAGIACLVVLHHFTTRIWSGLSAPWSTFDPVRALPYASLIACTVWIARLRTQCIRNYEAFLRTSPGIHIPALGDQSK